jgi:hypothetical protein
MEHDPTDLVSGIDSHLDGDVERWRNGGSSRGCGSLAQSKSSTPRDTCQSGTNVGPFSPSSQPTSRRIPQA